MGWTSSGGRCATTTWRRGQRCWRLRGEASPASRSSRPSRTAGLGSRQCSRRSGFWGRASCMRAGLHGPWRRRGTRWRGAGRRRWRWYPRGIDKLASRLRHRTRPHPLRRRQRQLRHPHFGRRRRPCLPSYQKNAMKQALATPSTECSGTSSGTSRICRISPTHRRWDSSTRYPSSTTSPAPCPPWMASMTCWHSGKTQPWPPASLRTPARPIPIGMVKRRSEVRRLDPVSLENILLWTTRRRRRQRRG
mmetsp:Transcript_28769/g.80320  ORF Transcript_28769/g.80320 Transcript_28769/m.80320 type:complete len:249 (+) Transcript_28769:487-1233(+)